MIIDLDKYREEKNKEENQGKSEEDGEIAYFAIDYIANCHFEIDYNLDQQESEEFPKRVKEELYNYLKLNYSEKEYYNNLSFKFDLDNPKNTYYFKEENGDEKLAIEFTFKWNKKLEFKDREKTEYMWKGDYWVAENKMEDIQSFITRMYKIEVESVRELTPIAQRLNTKISIIVDNFVPRSKIFIKEGYTYFDIWD